MTAAGTFSVASFVPATLAPPPEPVETGLPVGVATMEKRYDGEITGRSATVFTSAYDQERGVGTYVAMESFEGALNGVEGTFNFVHAATTHGSGRTDAHFAIVPGSGTGGLAGIEGTGGIAIVGEEHRVWFEYELA
jgi:uncharacterized protein DUF3224